MKQSACKAILFFLAFSELKVAVADTSTVNAAAGHNIRGNAGKYGQDQGKGIAKGKDGDPGNDNKCREKKDDIMKHEQCPIHVRVHQGPTIDERNDTKYSLINVPEDISEQSGISGLEFTEFFKEYVNDGVRVDIRPDEAKGTDLVLPAKRVALASSRLPDYTPVVGSNYIEIDVDEGDAACSTTDLIWMWFGRLKVIGLKGNFEENASMSWDLNDEKGYLETIDADDWDMITLENKSKDGIKIKRIKIVHSSVPILNWENADVWLDHSDHEAHSHLGLSAKILDTKLQSNHVAGIWNTQIHWAVRELGKTNGLKYGAVPGEEWCSEFASYVLRKALWDTPDVWIPNGIWDIDDMLSYFESIGRRISHDDITSGAYVLQEGDYLAYRWPETGGTHSGIFIKYNAPFPPPPTRRALTPSPGDYDDVNITAIEGNTSGRVAIRTTNRQLKDVYGAGNTQ